METAEHKIVTKQIVKIMPYVNPDSENMGLTKYGMVLHDGADYKEFLTCLERNGVKRWLTGLNEHAPEIIAITDSEDKAAAIKKIRDTVVFLERALGSNVIEANDPEFWNKVITVHPTNHSFWNEVYVQPSNEPLFLDPEDPHDLIKIFAIEAGGFSEVAKSYEDAKMASAPPKFYLDRAVDTASTKTEVKKIKNEALGTLEVLLKKNPRKLFYVIKNIDPNSDRYRNSTSVDIIYDYLDNYISGAGFERSSKKAALEFIKLCKMKDEHLKVKAVVADASFYKMIGPKEGLLYYRPTDTIVGGNVADVVAFYENPLNAKDWELILTEVEKYWNSN